MKKLTTNPQPSFAAAAANEDQAKRHACVSYWRTHDGGTTAARINTEQARTECVLADDYIGNRCVGDIITGDNDKAYRVIEIEWTNVDELNAGIYRAGGDYADGPEWVVFVEPVGSDEDAQ